MGLFEQIQQVDFLPDECGPNLGHITGREICRLLSARFLFARNLDNLGLQSSNLAFQSYSPPRMPYSLALLVAICGTLPKISSLKLEANRRII